MIRSEDLGSGAVEVILLCPWTLPLRDGLVAIEPHVVVDQIAIPVDLVVLIHVTVVALASLENDGLRSFLLGEVEIVERDDRRRARITTERRVLIFDCGKVLIFIPEQEFPHSSSSSEAIESYVDTNVTNVLVEVSIDGLLGQLLD